MAKSVKQYRTTFSTHWTKRLQLVIEKTGMKEAELLRDAVKEKIEKLENKNAK
jgi:predicted DNA-binding protein